MHKKPVPSRGRRGVSAAQIRAAHPRGQVKVDYHQDAPNVPVVVKGKLDALSLEHTGTRQQLDILRKTRGQRDVGAVKVPRELMAPTLVSNNPNDPNSDAGVERRGMARIVLPANE